MATVAAVPPPLAVEIAAVSPPPDLVLGGGETAVALQRPHLRVVLPGRRRVLPHPRGGLPARQQAPGGRRRQPVQPDRAVQWPHGLYNAAGDLGGEDCCTRPVRGSQRPNRAGIICLRRRGPSNTPSFTPAAPVVAQPYVDNYSGYSVFISGRAQPGEGATADFMRGGPFPQHLRPTDHGPRFRRPRTPCVLPPA